MVRVQFYNLNSLDDKILKFVVIGSRYQELFLFVQQNSRNTWEMPGGHREHGETIEDAAHRELFEETGAIKYDLESLCEYSVMSEGIIRYGRVFIVIFKV